MQSNDFDKGIQDLLNSNTPEYNPADWDRMEDMLHHAGATSSPKQGAEGSAGSNAAGAAKGVAAAGGKVWVIAAMVALTAVNVAVLVTSQNPSENTTALATEEQATPQELPTDQVLAPETAQAETTPAAAEQPAENGQDHFQAGLQGQKDLTTVQTETRANRPAAAAAPLNAGSGNGSRRSLRAISGSGANGTAKAAGSGSAMAGIANSGSAGNAGNSGGSGFGSTGINKAGQEAVVPCLGNRQPYLPYLVAGTDTVTNFTFTLKTCEPFCLNLPGRDSDSGDQIRFSADLSQLPGAVFETNPDNKAQASFCWTPKAAQARQEAFALKVNLQNEHCPGFTTYTILLKVAPSAAVRISGDTLLMAGQQTRLRANSTLPEASFKWLPGKGLDGPLNSNEILASPAAATTYTVQMTTASGCKVTATHAIRMADEAGAKAVFVPNIFTPNGDMVNDFFEVKGIEPGQMDLTVYNRSGKLVYANPRYDNSWNGENLPAGMYTYVLKNHLSGKLLRGIVEINR